MNFTNPREFTEYALEDDFVIDVSTCIPNGGNENDGFSYVFDDVNTPVKECGDMVYNVENNKKEGLLGESVLQVKRRRMLQFQPEVLDSPFCNEEFPQTFFGSQETDGSLGMDISELSQWVSSFTENTSASCSEVLDLSSEEWVAGCFNDPEVYFSVDETGKNNKLWSPGGQINTELDNPFSEAKVVPDQPRCTRQNIVFKGKKSYMRSPSELPSSVAYPFGFIKPCGIHGDVTLKDINQKILTPQPKSKPKYEDHSDPYPKSALTGKPVVGKTKIRTEGGTGSITIMRTKG
ncbi:hypothetical protein Leryth_017587 [Lithospermum erythrorhizon]|nr:hypothetical protein Leryth_017587 [Lithospermum erythrorhizon]